MITERQTNIGEPGQNQYKNTFYQNVQKIAKDLQTNVRG